MHALHLDAGAADAALDAADGVIRRAVPIAPPPIVGETS
jgi:hypothetical protein